ncbi:DUF5787 family protein [Halomicrococcus sp. NG-SE-24]|uniref:DUF5787 family protein n=1 Tax=Halomicrococcus sp. NG-SE-24 TaxID=3436928 RepID=UPI003D99AD82
MREYPFELALCAHLEATTDRVVARQIGAGVHAPGNRVLDVVCVEPGPEFEERAALTSETIPPLAVESEAGVGRARPWRDAVGASADHARRVVDRAVEVGFFERERQRGREYVRQVARYPDWVGRLVGVENKPDLGDPGDLETQLRKDVSLALVDEIVLATESYVTRAHCNRLPDEVGIWRFDPETGEREVVREAEPLATDEAGVELLDVHPGRTDVRVAGADAKARRRRRMAERAYGKGWRPDALPACAEAAARDGGLPHCRWKGTVVDPRECGPACPGHDPADPPEFDADAERDDRSPWVADPEGRARRQAGLDRFG